MTGNAQFGLKSTIFLAAWPQNLSHMPHCFEGVRMMLMNRPWAIHVLIMNIHNPFDVIVWCHNVAACFHNRSSIATAPCTTPSLCRVPLNGMFHQDSTTQWNKLRIWKICNIVVSNSIDKSHRNSVCPQYVCDESQNARGGCAKWQWNTLDWCYWIALTASPVMQSSNTVSCVSLPFRTPPCVLAILTDDLEQGKSEGFDSCNWPSNLAQIWSKSSIFQPVWPWNLMDELQK